MASRRQARGARARPGRKSTHDIIVIGASAGGVEATRQLVHELPADLPAAVFIVLHLGPSSPGLFPEILSRSSALRVAAARDGAPIRPGNIYVAPADHHLLLERGRVRVTHGPKENRHRPAIDPLFRSAAWHYGPRVVGVVLTGMLDDGTAGLWSVKVCGGVAIVQDPADALFPDMPANAARYVHVDYSLPLDRIAAQLAELAHRPAGAKPRAPAAIQLETQFASQEGGIQDMGKLGQPSAFTCPTCKGALWELQHGGALRYRCHTGHAFGAESLLDAQNDDTDSALNIALRSMQERTASLRHIADRHGPAHARMRDRYLDKARELERSAETLRKLLARG
jgi:two-component system, chemotaxis family, protein-glutamate methylesterase/glutaminase